MKSEITLIKDREWSVIDGEFCRVLDFNPLGSVKDGKISTLSIKYLRGNNARQSK
jgi:hypothetical protein